LKERNLIHDELAQRDEAATNSIAFARVSEATGRLEPLAAPLGRLTSTLRRHLWLVDPQHPVQRAGPTALNHPG
jgi:hypothetical protein